MRIAIVDESASRASVIREGLAQLDGCEIFVVTERHGLLARIEAIAPDHHSEVASGVISIDFALPQIAPDLPPTQPPEGGMYRFFRAVAEGAVQLTRRLVG